MRDLFFTWESLEGHSSDSVNRPAGGVGTFLITFFHSKWWREQPQFTDSCNNCLTKKRDEKRSRKWKVLPKKKTEENNEKEWFGKRCLLDLLSFNCHTLKGILQENPRQSASLHTLISPQAELAVETWSLLSQLNWMTLFASKTGFASTHHPQYSVYNYNINHGIKVIISVLCSTCSSASLPTSQWILWVG